MPKRIRGMIDAIDESLYYYSGALEVRPEVMWTWFVSNGVDVSLLKKFAGKDSKDHEVREERARYVDWYLREELKCPGVKTTKKVGTGALFRNGQGGSRYYSLVWIGFEKEFLTNKKELNLFKLKHPDQYQRIIECFNYARHVQ